MTKLKAKVRPDVLVWARESAGLSAELASSKLRIAESKLAEWEAGTNSPSIPQLRKMAELYKRPLAVFYLAAPPERFQALKDFRRMPGTAMPIVDSAIVIEERRARQRRELVIELSGDLEEVIPDFTISATLEETPERVGSRVREELGVTDEVQRQWKDGSGRKAFNAWRERIESKGVLVFQSDRFGSSEASGFAIWESVAPIIVISRKSTSPRRKTFSLLHEFAHLLLRSSGVSDLDIDGDTRRPPEEQRVEVFCNAVASAALLPRNALLASSIVSRHMSGQMEWSDEELRDIASNFGVSREVVLRRLLTLRKTTRAFYVETKDRYQREWDEARNRQRLTAAPEGIPRNMPVEIVGNFGRPFVGLVLENYNQDQMSLSEAAGYLGLKTKHMGKVAHLLRTGG
jgi:Zn-dependent peptidase ImmA (M78 family)/transcriptional regulator with XRE-family HTH domain